MCDTKQVSHWGFKNIRHYRTKFSARDSVRPCFRPTSLRPWSFPSEYFAIHSSPWHSKVCHTDRVVKPATNDSHHKMHSTCIQAVCTKFCRLKYYFISTPTPHFLKWSGRKVDVLPPSSTEIKNAWSYTSIHPHTFMARCLTKRCYFTARHVRIQIAELNHHTAWLAAHCHRKWHNGNVDLMWPWGEMFLYYALQP